MSYVRPDHDAADASWEGAPTYTRPDHDAADASWVAEGGNAISIAATMRYQADVQLHFELPPVVQIAATMRYAADIRIEHYVPVAATISATFRPSASITLQTDGPPVIMLDDETAVDDYIFIAKFEVARNVTDYPVETVYVTNVPGGLTLPNGTFIQPGLQDPGWIRREMSSGAALLGETRASFGEATLVNVDGAFDWLDSCGVDGRTYTLYMGSPGDAFPSGYDTLFTVVMLNKVVGADKVQLQLRGYEQLLDVPICKERFAGTGGVEGGSDLTNKPKPRWYDVNLAVRSKTGTFNSSNPYVMEPISQRPPPAIPMVLLDEAKQLYFVCQNPTRKVTTSHKWNAALDGGFPYARNNDYGGSLESFLSGIGPDPGDAEFWRGTNGPTYVRLGSMPVYEPSVMPGHGMTMSRSTPTFTSVVRDELGLDIASHNDPADFFGYYEGDVTYLQAMSDLAPIQGLFFGFDRLGKFFARKLRDPAEVIPSLEIDASRIAKGGLTKQAPSTGNGLPVTSVTYRGWKNHMYGQTLAPAVFEDDYPDFADSGTTITPPGAGDIRVINVLHWLQKEYATDASTIPPPPEDPPAPPVPPPPGPPAPPVVDILVEDQFTGSGAVNSHPHDQAMYGHHWSGASGYTIASGDLVGAPGAPGTAYAMTIPTEGIDFSQEMIQITGEWIAPVGVITGTLLRIDLLDDSGTALPGRSLVLSGVGSGSNATANLTGDSGDDVDVRYVSAGSHPFTLRIGDDYSVLEMAGGSFPAQIVADIDSDKPEDTTYGGARLLLGYGSKLENFYVQRIQMSAPPKPAPSPWPPEPPEPGVLFLDTFQGEADNIDGHTPDYAEFGHTWQSQPLLKVDDGLTVDGPISGGMFTAQPAEVSGVSLAGLVMTWKWTAPSPLPSWHPLDPVAELPMLMLSLDGSTSQETDVDGSGEPITPTGYDLGRYFRLLSPRDNATGPYLVFGTQVETVTVTPGQEYSGSLAITNDGATLTFLGETMTHTLTEIPPGFDMIRGAMWWGGELTELKVAGGTPMTVVFHDTFEGAGLLKDHTPDVATLDMSWGTASTVYSVAGGRMTTSTEPPVGPQSVIVSALHDVVIEGMEVAFVWKAPEGPMPSTNVSNQRVLMEVGVIDGSGSSILPGAKAEVWTRGSINLTEETVLVDGVGQVAVAMSSGEEYSGKITIRDSGVTVDMAGASITYVPNSSTKPSVRGFGGLWIKLHHKSSLLQLTVTVPQEDE